MSKLILLMAIVSGGAMADTSGVVHVDDLLKSHATTFAPTISATPTVAFNNASGVVGTLDFSGNELKFTGDADASAKIFIDYLRYHTEIIRCETTK